MAAVGEYCPAKSIGLPLKALGWQFGAARPASERASSRNSEKAGLYFRKGRLAKKVAIGGWRMQPLAKVSIAIAGAVVAGMPTGAIAAEYGTLRRFGEPQGLFSVPTRGGEFTGAVDVDSLAYRGDLTAQERERYRVATGPERLTLDRQERRELKSRRRFRRSRFRRSRRFGGFRRRRFRRFGGFRHRGFRRGFRRH